MRLEIIDGKEGYYKVSLTVNASGPRYIRLVRKYIIWKTCQRKIPLIKVSLKSVVGGASITDVEDGFIMSGGIKRIPRQFEPMFCIRYWWIDTVVP